MNTNKFVHYEVIMEENTGSESNPNWKTHKASGIVSDTPDKMGKIFSQHSDLLHCSKIVKVDYYPIRV